LADEHILEHRQRRNKAKVLMDEADAVLAKGTRRQRQRHGLTADMQLRARFRSVEAGKNLDQGRLARSILPEQAMDFPWPDFEGGIVESPMTAEDFGDTVRRRARGSPCR
jgi:hypothetical protein